ncbi:ArsR/SmtB family transcription factor [Streptomyces sp. NPDC058195]|uniref:ArsR/SmtB family transcription factor n=1 Tax=Streptomyces sp. NPDC058195 TaxID=3346375 RepID=UPI0036E07D9B
MLRIHFSQEDLGRIRLVGTWGPLAETFFSLMTVQHHSAPALFGGWSQRVRRESAVLSHPASALFRDSVLDLFTVTGPTASLEEGLEALLHARPDHLQDEIIGASESHAHYSGKKTLWGGSAWGDPAHDRADRQELVDFLGAFHHHAVAPYWPLIRSRLHAEQTSHARVLAEGGGEAMLAGLPPGFRWRSPVLEIGRGPVTGDVKLQGRGLTLVPSAFCQTRPITYSSATDDQAPILLFIPLIRTASDAAGMLGTSASGSLKALENLLGRTRARTLDSVGQGPCTTSQLASRICASLATASEQATILRQAGLITTTRHGSAVHHTLTRLGTNLLNGTPEDSP